jgi:hypothetical protein
MILSCPSEREETSSLTATEDETPAFRECFLVLGMHRSGTSAISGVLSKLGPQAARNLMEALPQNPKGFWEPWQIVALHDRILESAGSSWHDWRRFNPEWYNSPIKRQFLTELAELLRAEFGSSPSFVVKDPRICRFLPFWKELLRDEKTALRAVIPVRLPLEVAQSLRTRDGFTLSKGLLIWLRHVLDAEAETRGMPRTIVPWSRFFSDWRPEAARMADQLGVTWPRLTDQTADEIDAFLAPELRHERQSESTTRAHPDVHEWVMATYDAMVVLADEPGSNSARAALDDVRERFNAASKLFGRAMVALESDSNAARKSISEIVAEKAATDARLIALAVEKGGIESELTNAHAALQALQGLHVETLASLQQLQSALAEAAVQLETERAHRVNIETRAAALISEKAAAEAGITEASATIQQLQASHTEVSAQLEAERAQRVSVEAHAAALASEKAAIEAGMAQASGWIQHLQATQTEASAELEAERNSRANIEAQVASIASEKAAIEAGLAEASATIQLLQATQHEVSAQHQFEREAITAAKSVVEAELLEARAAIAAKDAALVELAARQEAERGAAAASHAADLSQALQLRQEAEVQLDQERIKLTETSWRLDVATKHPIRHLFSVFRTGKPR